MKTEGLTKEKGQELYDRLGSCEAVGKEWGIGPAAAWSRLKNLGVVLKPRTHAVASPQAIAQRVASNKARAQARRAGLPVSEGPCVRLPCRHGLTDRAGNMRMCVIFDDTGACEKCLHPHQNLGLRSTLEIEEIVL